jgi:hypothetical protein
MLKQCFTHVLIDFPEGSYLSNFFLIILSENFPPRPHARVMSRYRAVTDKKERKGELAAAINIDFDLILSHLYIYMC